MSKERAKKLIKLVNDTSVILLGQKSVSKKRDGYSSGSKLLNYITTGHTDVGYVKGRIYEIYGPEGSGKTTLALHVLAEVQKRDGVAAFIDVEHALDPVYAEKIGVKTDELLFSQPDSGEHALQLVESQVIAGVDLIVVDSVAALVPQAELDGEMGDIHMGLQARLMSQAMRKLTGVIKKHSSIVLFTNQIRYKIGIVFGSPETTSGGVALKFYTSVRMEVKILRADKIVKSSGEKKKLKSLADKKPDKNKPKSGITEELGTYISVKIVKNKLHPPFKTAKIRIIYGEGIDAVFDILALASSFGVVRELGEKSFVYRGKKRNVSSMDENSELLKSVYSETQKVMAKV